MCCSGCSALHSRQQTAATHFNVLQCTVMHCNVLQRTATYGNALQLVPQRHRTTQRSQTNPKQRDNRQHTATTATPATHCNTMHHAATHCNTRQQCKSKTKRQETRPSMCRQRGKLCQPACHLAPCLSVSFLHTPIIVSASTLYNSLNKTCLLNEITGKRPVEATDA